MLDRLIKDAKNSTASATVLAKIKMLEWQAGSDNDKLDEASKLLYFAANQGDPEASYILGTTEIKDEENSGGKYFLCEDEEERKKYLLWALKCGFRSAMDHHEYEEIMAEEHYNDYALEELNEDIPNLDRKVKRLRPLAESGDAKAQWELGCAINELDDTLVGLILTNSLHGEKVIHLINKNAHKEASEWKRLAIFELSKAFHENGEIHPPALPDLAKFYENSGDFDSAEKCLRIAFDKRHGHAAWNLASFLLNHKARDIKAVEEARGLLVTVVQKNYQFDGKAALRLALMFLRGEGGECNLDKAKELLEMAIHHEGHHSDEMSQTFFTAKLALQLGWNCDREGVVELLIRWLDKNDLSVCKTFPLGDEDIAKLHSLNANLFPDLYKLKIRQRKSIREVDGREKYTSIIYRYWNVYEFYQFIDALLSVVMHSDLSNTNFEQLLFGGRSMAVNYFLGKIALHGRLGKANPDEAKKYFREVEDIADEICSDVGIGGPNGIQEQEFFDWLRRRAKDGLLRAENMKLLETNSMLERTKTELENSKAELEDMMVMFAHKFRGSVDSLIANAEMPAAANRDLLFKDIARTMSGILDILSFISSHSEQLLPQLRKDNEGPHTLKHLLHKAIWLAINQLLSKRNVERMTMLYFNYARRENKIPLDTSPTSWGEEKSMRIVRDSIRATLALDFNGYGDFEDLDGLLAWCSAKLVPVQVKGIKEASMQFSEAGVKESLLLAICTEMVLNAIKHYDDASTEPIVLTWESDAEYARFSCVNPTSGEARKRGENSKGGLKSLSHIAESVKGVFTRPSEGETARAVFAFPADIFQ